MSKTRKGGKEPGYEFWSRRDSEANGCGKNTKKITKRKERARQRRMINRIQRDPEDFDKRFSGE